MKVVVGARGSNLSIKQVEEVLEDLRSYAPQIVFEPIWTMTKGDLDLTSSLVPMDKTNFFTKEIDEMLLAGKCRIAIHSAKDLPEPLPKGLFLIALTKGQDPSDSLVLQEGETLKKNGIIGSSSLRRNSILRTLRPDLSCVEVRGPIEKRLEKLASGEIDGLVVAEAALIRLGLTHLNRIPLPGETAVNQGKLAIIAREGDKEMEELFAPLDRRTKGTALYVGIHAKEGTTHFPLIEIVPRPFDSPEITSAFADIPQYTHIIFTSKSGVDVFFNCMKHHGHETIKGKEVIAVGKATAGRLREKGVEGAVIATDETQEGVIHMLAMEDLDDAYILLPQSSRARPSLAQTLLLRRVRHQLCHLYDTRVKKSDVKPDLESFDEIIFTSPSTVDAFIEIFGSLPKGKKLTSIGPITSQKLKLSIR